jgi:transposase
MEYVGVDYHTKFALATRMTKDGQIISQDKVPNTRGEIRDYLSQLPDDSQIAIEATNNWYAFCEYSHDLPIDIRLVHPSKTKIIAHARIKNDALDSKVLADLLRSNFIAEAYLAPQEIRDIRELVRYRTSLVRVRAQFLTRIRSVLFKTGTNSDVEARDIASAKGRRELANLDLRPIYKDEIDSCLRISDFLKEQILEFEKQIEEQATLDDDARLLITIPGISFFSALLITSEIGDYTRFSSSRKLCSWAGLVPSTFSSGGKTRRGRITRQGSANLRFVLLQAVRHATKKNSQLKKLYNRTAYKHGRKVARIAVSRKLLAIMLQMLKNRKPFRCNDSNNSCEDSDNSNKC